MVGCDIAVSVVSHCTNNPYNCGWDRAVIGVCTSQQPFVNISEEPYFQFAPLGLCNSPCVCETQGYLYSYRSSIFAPTQMYESRRLMHQQCKYKSIQNQLCFCLLWCTRRKRSVLIALGVYNVSVCEGRRPELSRYIN